MDLSEVLRRRRMVRHFTTEPVDDGAVERIVRAGLRGPSAGYSQGCAMVVLRSPEERARLWDVHGGEGGWPPDVERGVRRAPLLVVVLTSKQLYLERYALADKGWVDRDEARWPVPYWHVDAGCMAMLVLLAAVDEGLGALLFGILPGDVAKLRRSFSVPEEFDVVGCVAIGHPDPGAPRRDLSSRRRRPSEVVHAGRWGSPFFGE